MVIYIKDGPIATLNHEPLQKVAWEDVSDGDTVYLYAKHEGKEYGCGPFKVVSASDRQLTRVGSCRWFFHYPEELYEIE